MQITSSCLFSLMEMWEGVSDKGMVLINFARQVLTAWQVFLAQISRHCMQA